MSLLWAVGIAASSRSAWGAQEDLSFEVLPRRICRGDTVELRWDEAEDRARLTARPVVPGTRQVDEEGSLRVALNDTTLFRMIAVSDGDTATAAHEVAVFSSGVSKRFAFPTAPLGDSSLVAEGTTADGVWAERIRIGRVAGLDGRDVTVQHAGREATLPADSTLLTAFRGTRVGGPWRLVAPILSHEHLGDPRRAPPARLHLRATLLCLPR